MRGQHIQSRLEQASGACVQRSLLDTGGRRQRAGDAGQQRLQRSGAPPQLHGNDVVQVGLGRGDREIIRPWVCGGSILGDSRQARKGQVASYTAKRHTEVRHRRCMGSRCLQTGFRLPFHACGAMTCSHHIAAVPSIELSRCVCPQRWLEQCQQLGWRAAHQRGWQAGAERAEQDVASLAF